MKIHKNNLLGKASDVKHIDGGREGGRQTSCFSGFLFQVFYHAIESIFTLNICVSATDYCF